MRQYRAVLWLCLPVLTAAAGCGEKDNSPPPKVAATTSFLECAACEFLEPGEPVLRLVGPGMCPEHFDANPSMMDRLRGCRVLLRFGFQERLEKKFANLADAGLRIAPVKIDGGLCEPESYLSACRQTAEAFVSAGLLDRATADERLAGVAERMASLSDWAKGQIEAANLKGTPVLVSKHQAAFCRWLGLNVVATFVSSDTAGVHAIDDAYRAGKRNSVKIVVANLPAGRGLADALAEQLEAKVVVFGNFPNSDGFDKLIRDNVEKLILNKR